MTEREQILVVRRDNIGDLVLTTPLISALRALRPRAWIGAFVNSYNAPVLDENPDLDAVFAYDKAKHRPDRSRAAVFAGTARLLLSLRRKRIDHLILAGPGAQREAYALARWIAPRKMTGFVTQDFAPAGITFPLPYGDGARLHEAEDVYRLASVFGVSPSIPACTVRADAAAMVQWRERIATLMATQIASADGEVTSVAGTGPLIAIHISARRARQRWPAARFAALMQQLHARHAARFLLLWSPGAGDDARHPGDDAKAREVLAGLPAEVSVAACPTHALRDLIALLALADCMICADGGAMHLAAGLDKPVLALFGDSPSARWYPWGVPCEVVQAPAGDVAQLAVSEVLMAWERLTPSVSRSGS
jgi:heptosyltransferase III